MKLHQVAHTLTYHSSKCAWIEFHQDSLIIRLENGENSILKKVKKKFLDLLPDLELHKKVADSSLKHTSIHLGSWIIPLQIG